MVVVVVVVEVDCDKGAVAVERARAGRERVSCLRGLASVLAARRERLASIVSDI